MVAKNFEASAVNLCNPEPVRVLLDELQDAKVILKTLTDALKASNVKLAEKIAVQSGKVDDLQNAIREAIEIHGSYQDLENERYGVRYRSVRKTYDPIAFKRNYPDHAPAVITESVNIKVLEGLVKGKLITEEALVLNKVTQEHESFSFYVR